MNPSKQPQEQQRARRRFLTLAGVLMAVYGGLWFFYATPALSHARLHKELVVWPVTLGLIWLYWQGYRTVRTGAIPAGWLAGFGLVVGFLAAMIPPFHSTDVFGYINRGWQQWHYGLNPYVYTIDAIKGWESDPMITDHWVNNPSPYGFLYLLIAKSLTALGGDSKATTLLVFKLGNLLVHLLTAWLIWLGVKALNKTEERTNQAENQPESGQLTEEIAAKPPAPQGQSAVNALYLYAFNPLILIHGLANGHNDMLMGFFILLAAFVAVIGAWVWILPALIAATLIKYGAVVILPPAVLLLIKNRRWSALLGGLLLGTLLFFATGAPFLGEWSRFHLKDIGTNAFVSHGSVHSVFYSAFKTLAKEVIPPLYQHKEIIRDFLKNTLLLGYALFYAWLGWQRLRAKEYPVRTWIYDALLLMAVLVCLVSLKFYPWYVGMFFPLAFYLPEGHWLRRFVIVLSCAQLFSITLIGQAHMLNFIVMTGLPVAWIFWQLRREKRQDVLSSEGNNA